VRLGWDGWVVWEFEEPEGGIGSSRMRVGLVYEGLNIGALSGYLSSLLNGYGVYNPGPDSLVAE